MMFVEHTAGNGRTDAEDISTGYPEASFDPTRLQEILNRNLLSKSSVDAFRKSYQKAEPFRHIVIKDLFSASFLDTINDDFNAVSFADWLRFDTEQETKRATRGNTKLESASQSYFDLVHRGAFISFLSEITGISGLVPDPTLFGGGLHEIPAGGKFGVHIDFNKHPTTQLDTRLAFITYLNKDWLASYGGELELWDHQTNRCIKKIIPNSARRFCSITVSIVCMGILFR